MLSPSPQEFAVIATVTQVETEYITASSVTHTVNVPIANMFGIMSYPKVGEQVMLIPTGNGEYACIGNILKSNSSNQAITIQSNGDVLINGVTITKNGTIIGKE